MLPAQMINTVGFCTAVQPTQSLWLSSTIINSRIFSLQTVHLQIQLLSAVVSGDGEPALNWLRVVFATTTTTADICNPLQSFSRSLSDPGHPVVAECESRCCTGQFVGFSRLFNCWFRFCQSLTINTCQDEKEESSSTYVINNLKTDSTQDL